MPVRIGKYEILEEVGRGSMGTVYSAYDPFTDNNVAIKLAHSELLTNEDGRAKFVRLFFNEAHATSVLNHPNILRVYDANVEDDYYYLVMELIPEVTTLTSFCKADRLLPLRNIVSVVYHAAKALDYAHRQGIIHRDVKPTNLLQTKSGQLKLADFSVALINRDDYEETHIGGLMGSPLYMSPEQITERDVSSNTDIFSLGIVMFELLTGQHPFRTDNLNTLVSNISTKPVPPLSEFRNDIPEELQVVLNKMVAKDPGDRYRMGLDLASDLARIFKELGQVNAEDILRQKFETIKNLGFFEYFTDVDIWELIRACDWENYSKEQLIIQEGEEDSSFYIIISGIVSVEKNGHRIDYLQEGDCFGEMSYLTNERRTATIRANTDVSLIKVNSTTLERANEGTQLRFLKVFVKTLSTRLAMTTRALTRN
ncbi:MAG: serine/threonine-protein kinase [Gammaproteobacteria bacterium]